MILLKQDCSFLKLNRSQLEKALLHDWIREMLYFSVAIIHVKLKYSNNADEQH